MPQLSDRAWRRLLDQVRRAVRAGGLWAPGDRLLVACSGGLDSTAALALLHHLSPSLGHSLVAAHVDHGLRADGARDAQSVGALAETLGISFVQQRLALAPGPDLQARAREARYAALQGLAGAHGCAHIVTAHHADDQAETLLLRLSRGCGLQALAGIRAARGDGVVRPLLEVRKRELLGCAVRLGLSWREDPSNADLRHARNRLRHEVMPALEAARPRSTEGLARTAGNLADHAAGTAFFVQDWLDRHLHMEISGREVRLPRAQVPGEIAALGLMLTAVAARLGQPAPGRRATAQVHAWLAGPRGAARRCDIQSLRLELQGDDVRIAVSNVAPPPGPDYPGRRGC